MGWWPSEDTLASQTAEPEPSPGSARSSVGVAQTATADPSSIYENTRAIGIHASSLVEPPEDLIECRVERRDLVRVDPREHPLREFLIAGLPLRRDRPSPFQAGEEGWDL
jgi:hypothetical protein